MIVAAVLDLDAPTRPGTAARRLRAAPLLWGQVGAGRDVFRFPHVPPSALGGTHRCRSDNGSPEGPETLVFPAFALARAADVERVFPRARGCGKPRFDKCTILSAMWRGQFCGGGTVCVSYSLKLPWRKAANGDTADKRTQ